MKAALILTLGRVVLCPIFLIVYLFYAKLGLPFVAVPYILLALLSIFELSDVFDGMIARRKKEVTELGKILDPMADSIVKLSVFLSFTQGCVKLPLFFVFMFVARDAVISTLRTLCALRGTALAARASGKLKTILQAVAIYMILVLMIPYTMGFISLEVLRMTSFWVAFLTVSYAVISGVEYIWAYRNYIRQAWVNVS